MSPEPSDEASEARRQAENDRDAAREYVEEEAARKLAAAIRAIGRLRDHSRADSFVALVQRALEERKP